jgi:hypothetical protein
VKGSVVEGNIFDNCGISRRNLVFLQALGGDLPQKFENAAQLPAHTYWNAQNMRPRNSSDHGFLGCRL